MNKPGCIIIIVVFSLLSARACLSQPVNQTEENAAATEEAPLTESVKKGFEEAMQRLDAQKEEEHKKIASSLQAKLDSAAGEWISQQKKKRSQEVDTIVDQHWENLNEFGPRVHRNYYLRDFSYAIINTDVVKTDSMTGPYKAVMNLTEKLFVERYHSSSVTYPKDYYYTVTMPLKVNFEYYQDKFVVTGIESGKGSLDKGWNR